MWGYLTVRTKVVCAIIVMNAIVKVAARPGDGGMAGKWV